MPLTTDEAIQRFGENEERVNTFVNLDGYYLTNETVPRQVKTLPTLISEATTSLNAAIETTGYLPPVAYTSGIVMDNGSKTVSYNGAVYAPILSFIPFTTSGTFETSKFRVIQGVLDTQVHLELQNYAAIRSYTGSAPSVYARCKSTLLDGGAAVFRYDSTDTTSTDNNIDIIVDAGNRRWKKEYTNGLIPFGGAVRNVGGTWSMINDSAHEPTGISSVSQPDAYSYRVNFDRTISKVGTVLSVTDFEMAPYGPHTGANGGTSNATFCTYAPCTLYVNGRSNVAASPLWTSQTGPITTPDATSIQITHASRALPVDPPTVTAIAPASGSLTRQYHISWSASTTTITSLDDIQGYAYYDGSAWQLSFCPNLGVSLSYSGGGLTVTHPDATGHYIPTVSALGTDLRPEIASVGVSNFVIQFRDTSGAVVGPAATTGMKVLFRRGALVPSTMDAGVRFAVNLGLCKVANADVGNVSLNNFWIVGFNK